MPTDDPRDPDSFDDLRETLERLGVTRGDIDAALRLRLSEAEQEQPSPVRRPRRWIGIGVVGWSRIAATALAVVVVVTILNLVQGDGPDPAVAETPPLLLFSEGHAPIPAELDEDAQRVMARLAEVAAEQSVKGSGEIQETVLDGWWASSDEATDTEPAASVLIPTRTQRFYLPDGTMRSIERRGEPLDQSGRVTTRRGSWSEVEPFSDESFDFSVPGPDYPASLPTETDALVQALIGDGSACAGLRAGCLVGPVTQLHSTYVLPPRLVASLWRLLAAEPGIEYLGRTQDRLDRPAVAFAVTAQDPAFREIFFADPETGAWLGNETVQVAPAPDYDFTLPAVVQFTAIVEARLVESLP